MKVFRNLPLGGSHQRHKAQAGFSLMELTIVIVMVVILSSISISAAQDQWNNEQTYAVAQELGGWIGNVQRAAMRGLRCDLTIAPNAGLIRNGQVMATVSQSSGTSLPTSCLTYSPLNLEAVPAPGQFTITPNALKFSFTPRGTIANSSSDPVVIVVSNRAGGPVRCLRLDGLLAMVRIGYLQGSTCQTS
jgi:prepilin-type N-terminal cleavage/methylation domain-containing protein